MKIFFIAIIFFAVGTAAMSLNDNAPNKSSVTIHGITCRCYGDVHRICMVESIDSQCVLDLIHYNPRRLKRAVWDSQENHDVYSVNHVRASCGYGAVSYTHLRAHETRHDLVCRLL